MFVLAIYLVLLCFIFPEMVLTNKTEDLEKSQNMTASKLEFEDAAQLRDEINRLKAKQMGLTKKALEYKK